MAIGEINRMTPVGIPAIAVPRIVAVAIPTRVTSPGPAQPPPIVIVVVSASWPHINRRRDNRGLDVIDRRFGDGWSDRGVHRWIRGRDTRRIGLDNLLGDLRSRSGCRLKNWRRTEKREQHSRRNPIGMKRDQIRAADVSARSLLHVSHDHALIHFGARHRQDFGHHRRWRCGTLGKDWAHQKREAQSG